MAKDIIKLLFELLEGVKVCFCTLCSHQPDFGHCYFCNCHNHQPEPELTGEAIKLKDALNHSLDLLVRQVKENRGTA